jgi:Collagen triple helix repeat (20 copies)
MSRASVALIVAGVALLVSVAANVVAFTRTDSGIAEGSVELADLAPDARSQLRGEKGEPGKQGPRGPRGPRGAIGLTGIPGKAGTNATDLSDQVDALETIVYRLCGIWLNTTDEVGSAEESYWTRIPCA